MTVTLEGKPHFSLGTIYQTPNQYVKVGPKASQESDYIGY